MRLTVFGATGGTGQCLVEQALAVAHDVLAVVRDPTRLTVAPQSQLRVLTANVMEPGDIVAAVEECDAVISALGSEDRGPTSIRGDSTQSIIEAMGKTGALRLVITSGSMVDDTGDGFFLRHLGKPITRRILKHVCADMRQAEECVHASQLDWTILRPPRLVAKPGSRHYRIGIERNVAHGFTLPRADLASCILRLINDPKMSHKHVFVAS
jgi:putative NADH-flavin reductase